MSSRAASWLAWSLADLSVVMFAAVIALSALVPSAQSPSDRATVNTVSDALVFLSFLAFPLVGALIASRRPYNPIGWLLLVDGILWMLLNAFESYGAYGVAQPGSLPFPAAIAAQNNWLWVPAVGLLGTYLLLLSSFSQFANLTTSVSYARLVSPQSTYQMVGYWRWWTETKNASHSK